MKTSLRALISAHYGSYVDARTDRVRWQDHVIFEGLPLAVLAACFVGNVKLSTTASAAVPNPPNPSPAARSAA
jgi:hypothetical protein